MGFLISGILFPRIFSTEEIGLTRVLVSYSVLLAQFAVLGFNNVTVKLFPHFRDHAAKHHGFLGIALIVAFTGFLFSTALYLGFHDYIIENAKHKSPLFVSYYYYVIPLMFFTLLYGIFDTYYRVLYNAVKGTVYKEVVQRILAIIAIALFYFKLIDFKVFVILYLFSLAAPAVLMFIDLLMDKVLFLKPDFSYLNKELVKEMGSVAFFGIVASYSGVLVQNIDLIMVDHYLGLSNAGIYAITFFFGTLILIPLRTMGKISSVVISDSWKNNDKKNIFDIYKKSTLTLGIAGVYILAGIWGNINNVFYVIGDKFESGKYVILFIGLANLADVFSGTSSHIIVNSPKYKWLSYLLLIFALIVVVTNLMFIPVYGIIGAALATFISKLLYSGSKFVFLYRKYGFQPYNIKHVLLIITGFVTWYISTLIPQFDNFIVDIIVRSSVITVIFVPAVYFLKISEDVNDSIKKSVKRLKGE